MNARRQHRAQLLSAIQHERLQIARQLDKVRQLPSQVSKYADLAGSGRSQQAVTLALSVIGTLGGIWLRRHFTASEQPDPAKR